YSCVRIPELFLVNLGIPSNVPTTVDVSPQLPAAPPTLIPAIHLCSHLHIYLHAKKPNTVALSSDSFGCGWIQRDDDSFILESGSFLWTDGPISPQASELGFILQRKPHLYSPDWLCPQCNTAPEDINHLWTCPYILPELNPCMTHRKEIAKFRDDCISAFSSLKTLPNSFCDDFSALDCWDFNTPSASCLWLTRGLLPAHLTTFLKDYFLLSTIYKIVSPLLNDFQLELYGEIWLCRNVLFHAWEESQGISASSKSKTKDGLSSNSSVTSSHHHHSSLASVPQDSWISWISSSIIWGGSWISHLDFLRRLTVQPLRIVLW
ncbi:hypothetical protein RhiirA4_520509, partial [Rhizophagus irregularis]